MGLQAFERRLERMVEGVFARAFKSGLRPVELGRKVVRVMDDHRSVDVRGRKVVPNAFTVRLSADDHVQFADIEDTLVRELCDAGKTVLIETSGERDITCIDPRVHRIVDVKAPGSGESHRNRYENFAHLTDRDELKFVLASRADYEWSRALVEREALSGKVGQVLFSPVHGVLDPRALVSWVLADALPVRVNLQLHKYVWGPTVAGV